MNLSTRAVAVPALALVALLASGCRTNLLPEYANRIEQAHVVSITPDKPTISVGDNPGGSLVSIATDIATMGVAADVQRKLVEGSSPDEVSAQMSEVFSAELDRSFEWSLVPDAKTEHDTRIEVRIVRYGLFADSPSSPVSYQMSIEARMVYRPQNKLIWEYSTTYSEPLTNVHVQAGGHGKAGEAAARTARAVNAGVNLGLLAQLTPEALRAVFVELARRSGARLVDQIREDITD